MNFLTRLLMRMFGVVAGVPGDAMTDEFGAPLTDEFGEIITE
jgi:hypothetical protein